MTSVCVFLVPDKRTLQYMSDNSALDIETPAATTSADVTLQEDDVRAPNDANVENEAEEKNDDAGIAEEPEVEKEVSNGATKEKEGEVEPAVSVEEEEGKTIEEPADADVQLWVFKF